MATALDNKWIALGDGIAWHGKGCVINWLAYIPNRPTLEGTITYAKAGIKNIKERNISFSEDELHSEVVLKALPLIKKKIEDSEKDIYAELPDYLRPSWYIAN